MKRNIRYIVVHSTQCAQDASVKELNQIWQKVYRCETPPFHLLIEKDGEVKRLVHENCITGGNFAHDAHCLHVAYVGGSDKEGNSIDNRTAKQEDALFNIIAELTTRYDGAEVLAPNEVGTEFSLDASPGFDVKKWLGEYTPDLSERPFFESVETVEDEFFEEAA